jgi:spore germination protein GerM
MPVSALLVVLLAIAATVVFFAFLPTVRDAANLAAARNGRTDLAVPEGGPANTAGLAPAENRPGTDGAGGLAQAPEAAHGIPTDVDAVETETPAAVERPPETRERGIYLVEVGNDGADPRIAKVSRTMSASSTPLRDSLDALLRGPTDEEAAMGKVSFIPEDARIISAWVEGHDGFDTAYINFSDDFRYNTRGSEGLRLQLMQVVWTATEFANVRDVQILIEGNRVDFLHEGIMIGSPIGRGR